MFLLEPFIWMFSVKNFKRHFLYLLLVGIICWAISFIIFNFIGGDFFFTSNLILNILFILLEIILFLTPILCITGYFWCLTDNAIRRDTDVLLNRVYDGKTSNLKNIIMLPDWNLFRFIWRGIASVFASIIMYIPFVLLMILVLINLSVIASFWNLNNAQITIAIGILMFMLALLIPGLLWNYARRDSVLAVLNFPKAIYLMESYPKKYFLNTFLIVLFSLARSFIIRIILFALGLGAAVTSTAVPNSYAELIGSQFMIACVVCLIVGFIIDTYWIFVNAYLLGTIAPPSEY